MDRNEKLKQIRLIKNYLEKYGKYYDELELLYLKDNLDTDTSLTLIPDVLRQILAELNLLKDEANVYKQFADLIQHIYGLDKNIIEVGGGVIPSLSKIIALRQKEGTITVYDPRIIEENTLTNLILKKEIFTGKTKTTNTDLYIGFMPREATEVIIDRACLEKKDFIITLCSDGLNDEDSYYEDNEELVHSIIYGAERKVLENDLGKLEKTYLKSLGWEYPIIYNKR